VKHGGILDLATLRTAVSSEVRLRVGVTMSASERASERGA
jgi:hypothetical protein